jgi:D-amino-acid dehydrogenase
MKVLVLGAGVVGTTSAWYLAQAGHEVVVIDRQPDAGLETSFANGGQISVSHAEPWANPGAPAKIVKWLGREDAPLLFRLRADPRQWAWGLRFLFECLAGRSRRNTREILSLALYSRGELQRLRRDTGIEYDQLAGGILHYYTDAKELGRAIAQSGAMAELGCERELKSAAECVAIEPALARSLAPILGGTYTPGDESGDARKFTQALAALARSRAVTFRFETTVTGLETENGRVRRVRVTAVGGRQEAIVCDACVVALASYSPRLLAPLDVRIPVYPLKGYSITIPLAAGDLAPTVSLTDEAAKLAMSRLGDRLRVAGTAELADYSVTVNVVRCDAIAARIRTIFPGVSGTARAERWAGLRPATPSNVPLVGRTHVRNLYLNTGHGTLGWTMACGSGRAIADIVSGRAPEVDFGFLGLERNRARVAGPASFDAQAQRTQRATEG